MNRFQKMKSGFTMSELIIVLVIMGALSYITFNKLFGAKTKQEIEATIKADLEAITSAADKFRMNNREGKYTGLTIDRIVGYLPNNMSLYDFADAAGGAGTDSVGSLSFGNGCRYKVIAGDATETSERTFNIGMNCDLAITDFGWAEKEKALTEQVFWEFITQKYNYSDGTVGGNDAKGVVKPTYVVADDLAMRPVAADITAPSSSTLGHSNGIIAGYNLRGF